MGDLTKNFSRWEFRCSHCGKEWIDVGFVEHLQDLRNLAGLPTKVTCGCRCEEHNKMIGGATDSRHVVGDCADVYVYGLTPSQMYRLALKIDAFRDGGIGIYPPKWHPDEKRWSTGFAHLDERPYPARWSRIDGEYYNLHEGIEHDRRIQEHIAGGGANRDYTGGGPGVTGN